MESSSFYVTLPSNASMNLHPKNTQASYKVKLPKTLRLSNKYEVALSEIQFPVSWKTFVEPLSYTFNIVKGEDLAFQQVFFPVARYNSVRELVDSINWALKDYFYDKVPNAVVLHTNELTQKVTITCKEPYKIQFPQETCDVLGLEHVYYKEENNEAPYIYDITRGFAAMYIYCSVCEEQIVGDSFVPLLRAVAAKGKRGDYIVKSFGEPHYVPVVGTEMDTIEINIKDDTGAFVPFTFGKVICKLHFRQKTI